jgi:hypothetical protein
VVVCAAVLLYLPAWLILIAGKASPLFSVAVSPAITLAIYGLLEIIYAGVHIPSSWKTIFIPVVIIGIVSIIFTHLPSLKDKKFRRWGFVSNAWKEWALAGLYCVIGVIITWLIFVRKLDGFNSISQLFDNAWHLGIIRKFVNTANYSTLSSGNIVPTVGSTFYPTGWHSLVALIMSMTGVEIGLAENAVNTMIIAIVYPISIFVFMASIFREKLGIRLVASVTSLLFAAYPWRFLTFGPLYSNLLSFAVLPASMALLLKIIDSKTSGLNRFGYVLLCLGSFIGVSLTQPNAVFTLGVLLVPYLYSQVPKYTGKYGKTIFEKNLLTVLVDLAITAFIVIVWLVLYSMPALQRTVEWQWPAFVTKSQALIDIAFLGFHNAEPQMLLGILVFIGILYTIVHTEYLWISFSYFIICFLYGLSASTDGKAKQVLTGFWYHDAYRLGASASIMGVLLSAAGIYALLKVGKFALSSIAAKSDTRQFQGRVIGILCVFLVALVVLYPNYHLAGRGDTVTAFGAIRKDIAFWNSTTEPKSYTQAERLFVKRVQHSVPKGDVVLNQPYDGSVYAYGIDNLNVYYKAWEGNWMGKPTKDNYLISSELSNLSDSQSVCEAVQRTGAQYLLLLDRSDYTADPENSKNNVSMYAHYVRSDWRGIDQIDDSTPGFSVVLKDGNMRLYKINEKCMSNND